MKTGSFLLSIALFVVLLLPVAGLEIDRDELRGAVDADIEFENYEGPVERIDSREAIRGIGRDIGRAVRPDRSADYGGRYRAYRVLGDPEESLRAADIIELDRSARVDHIVNLRRIVAGYLESAWDYSREDADLLARFITIYNAVHRGDLPFFAQRYKSAVLRVLDRDRLGLATSYREWSGKTQIVIPIRDERVAGDLDAVDPQQLVDSAVIAELRTRSDLGIEDRKAIIRFIERVIEERTEVIAEERAAIEEEQTQIDERQEEIEEEIAEISQEEDAIPPEPEPEPEQEPQPQPQEEEPEPEIDTTPLPSSQEDTQPETTDTDDETDLPAEDTPTPPTSEDPPASAAPQTEREEQTEPEEQAPVEQSPDQRVAELEVEQEQLQDREEELQERQEQLDAEEEEVEELTEEVEDLYQDTAEDQATIDDRIAEELVSFVISQGDGTFELSVVNLNSLSLAGEQTIPVATRDLVAYQGGVLAAHVGSERLLLLDGTSLDLLEESDTRVVPGARILIVGQSILTVIPEGGSFYIGEFDPQLVLLRRSTEAVRQETDIVNRGDRLLVQGADGELRRLDLGEFQ